MDVVTQSLLADFARNRKIEAAGRAEQYQAFVNYLVVSDLHAEPFDADALTTGHAGLGGIAMLVNGTLVEGETQLEDIIARAPALQVHLLLIEAECASAPESNGIAAFCRAALAFITDDGAQDDARMQRFRRMKDRIYAAAPKFILGLPQISLCYATTENWSETADIAATRDAFLQQAIDLHICSSIAFHALDATRVQNLYYRTRKDRGAAQAPAAGGTLIDARDQWPRRGRPTQRAAAAPLPRATRPGGLRLVHDRGAQPVLTTSVPADALPRARPLGAERLPARDAFQDHLIDVSRAHLRAVTRKVGWPVSIAVRVGSRMVLLDSTHSETSLTYDLYYPGFSVPVVESASGSLCLALMSPEERADVLYRMRSAGDPPAEPMADEALRSIQQQGYMALDSEKHNRLPGSPSSIAVPILRDGEFVASLTMIYFATALRQEQAVERYMPLLQHRAQAISEALAV